MLVPHLLKIYFGLGWHLSVLEIVSVTKIKNKKSSMFWNTAPFIGRVILKNDGFVNFIRNRKYLLF